VFAHSLYFVVKYVFYFPQTYLQSYDLSGSEWAVFNAVSFSHVFRFHPERTFPVSISTTCHPGDFEVQSHLNTRGFSSSVGEIETLVCTVFELFQTMAHTHIVDLRGMHLDHAFCCSLIRISFKKKILVSSLLMILSCCRRTGK